MSLGQNTKAPLATVKEIRSIREALSAEHFVSLSNAIVMATHAVVRDEKVPVPNGASIAIRAIYIDKGQEEMARTAGYIVITP